MQTTFAASGPRPPVPVFMVAAAVVGFPLLLVSGVWTLLKENPLFWRDAGGYSPALRALVLATYYPLLGMNVLVCGIFTVLAAYEYRLTARCSRWTVAAGAMMWLLLAVSVALLTANNLENLLIGRELHYHLPYP